MKSPIEHTPVMSSPFTGIHFFFIDGDREIKLWGSKFTGKERISVNAQIISEKRTYGFKSVHTFNIESDIYEIELAVMNPLTENMSCTLIKNGTHFKTTKYSLWKDKKSLTKVFFTSFAIGATLGYTFINYVLLGN